MTTTPRALAPLLSAVALAFAAAPAVAPDTISTTVDPSPVSSGIAMNAQGRNVAAFEAPVGDRFAVFARSRSRAGGKWGPRARISGVTALRPDNIVVAIDDRGRAVVVWRRPHGVSGVNLRSALRFTATGAWQDAGAIADPTGSGAVASPVLALAGGRATFAWGEVSSTGWQVRRAVYDLDAPTARYWSHEEPQVLGVRPALAVDPGGDVVAIGQAGDRVSVTGVTAPVVVTSRAAGAAGWEAPVTLDPAGSQATIAIADGGQIVAAWVRGAAVAEIAVATRAGIGGGWAPPERLAAAGFLPVAAVGLTGQALVAYGVNLDTLDPPDPGLILPPSDLSYPLGDIMRARRRGPAGAWGAEETVFAFVDDMRPTYRKAEDVRAVVDSLGTTLMAWHSTRNGFPAVWATAAPAAAPFPKARDHTAISSTVAEQVALAPSGRGEAALMWVGEGWSDASGSLMGVLGSLSLQSDRVPAASCAGPPTSPQPATPDTITLSLTQLIINQRIYSAALRRADGLEGWLRARIAGQDLCGGGIGATALGAGVDVGPAPGPRTAPTATPRALSIRPAADKDGVVFTLSVEQLRINQRIASAALRRADALGARLDAGLSGGDIRLGAVSADRIDATIAAIRADATVPPAPTRTVITPAADKDGVVFTLSAAQLQINQRIGQAAIRRLNAVRGRLLDGISGDEMRRATITGANLAP